MFALVSVGLGVVSLSQPHARVSPLRPTSCGSQNLECMTFRTGLSPGGLAPYLCLYSARLTRGPPGGKGQAPVDSMYSSSHSLGPRWEVQGFAVGLACEVRSQGPPGLCPALHSWTLECTQTCLSRESLCGACTLLCQSAPGSSGPRGCGSWPGGPPQPESSSQVAAPGPSTWRTEQTPFPGLSGIWVMCCHVASTCVGPSP